MVCGSGALRLPRVRWQARKRRHGVCMLMRAMLGLWPWASLLLLAVEEKAQVKSFTSGVVEIHAVGRGISRLRVHGSRSGRIERPLWVVRGGVDGRRVTCHGR